MGHVATGEMKCTYTIFVRRPEEEKSFGIPRCI